MNPKDRKRTAAVLYADGMRQADIADRLSVQQSTVSRWIKESDVLRHTIQCTLADDIQNRLRALAMSDEKEDEIRKSLGEASEHVKSIHVFDSGPDSDDHDAMVRRVAGQAAPLLLDSILPRVRRIGVAWGRTLRVLVREVRQQAGARWSCEENVQCIPVCGDTRHVIRDPRQSSSLLAAELDRGLNGRDVRCLSLGGVSASIPDRCSEAEVLRYFRAVSDYGKIFGTSSGRRGLADKLDAVLTGVGTSSPREDPLYDEDVQHSSRDKARTLAAGNVAGIYLPRGSASKAERMQVHKMNARWTGLSLDRLRACARSAIEKDQIGVMVVSVGLGTSDVDRVSKAEVLRTAVNERIVSRMIIDHRLAEELLAS